ncbi:MAG: dihydrolipoyl dehydrogenase family protein [Acidimicrobiia bacterium]
MTDATYDVIVIGAGPAGENAADVAARSGLSTAIVESELAGGECSYWACIPSKTLLRPGEALAAAKRVPGAEAAVTGEIDIAAVLERRDAMVSHWDDAGQVEWLESAGVTFLRGHGRLDGPRRVTVTSNGAVTSYEAERAVVLATGSSADIPDIDGLAAVPAWDSRGVTSADAVPKRLMIIGGGVVGVEMAQAWAWLGSEVTILQKGQHLLSREEPFVGPEVQAGLEWTGVTVLNETKTKKVSRSGPDAPVVVEVQDGNDRLIQLEADQLVIATGRQPRTDDLGLESVGLHGGDYLDVNKHMQVAGIDGGWLYAVGDVNGRALLTHIGKYQARIAGAHIGGRSSAEAGPDVAATPRVIFTSPEVGAVGPTEADAREQGADVAVATYDVGKVSGASTLGQGYKGTAKLVIDRRRRVIVGATFVGPKMGELLHSATIAVVGEVPLERLWHAVPSFPTLSEVWLRLLEHYRDDEHWDPYG